MICVCYIINFTAPVIKVSFYGLIYYDVMMNVFILSGPQEKNINATKINSGCPRILFIQLPLSAPFIYLLFGLWVFFLNDLTLMPFMVIVSDTSAPAAMSRVQLHQTDEGLRSSSTELYVNRTISSRGAAHIVFDINIQYKPMILNGKIKLTFQGSRIAETGRSTMKGSRALHRLSHLECDITNWDPLRRQRWNLQVCL